MKTFLKVAAFSLLAVAYIFGLYWLYAPPSFPVPVDRAMDNLLSADRKYDLIIASPDCIKYRKAATIDYDKLAAQAGAISSSPGPKPTDPCTYPTDVFDAVSSTSAQPSAPAFDPSKPYAPVQTAAPVQSSSAAFDPNKSYEPAASSSLNHRVIIEGSFDWNAFPVVNLCPSLKDVDQVSCNKSYSDVQSARAEYDATFQWEMVDKPAQEKAAFFGFSLLAVFIGLGFYLGKNMKEVPAPVLVPESVPAPVDENILLQRDEATIRLMDVKDCFLLSPRDFENYSCDLFTSLGWNVQQTQYTGDGGKDAIMTKDGETFLLEVKSGSQIIGRRDIQIFHSAIVTNKAKGGFYVNTGRYSPGAVEYAKMCGISLYNKRDVARFVGECLAEQQTAPAPMPTPTRVMVPQEQGISKEQREENTRVLGGLQ